MTMKNDAFATYRLLRKEFEKRGYSYDEYREKDNLFVELTSVKGKQWKFQASRISYPVNQQSVTDLSVNKEDAYEFAQSNGIAIPYTQYLPANVTLDDDEVDMLLSKYKPLIVKPSDSSLSRGLTLNINTQKELNDAIKYARSVKSNVLVQQQVQGQEIRFLAINGKVVSALLRQTPRVIGNGRDTVAELLALENEDRASLKFPYIEYPLLSPEIINPELFKSSYIPQNGENVELSKATMIKNGCSVYDVLGEVDSSYIAMVEKLVSATSAGFLAIDIFIFDYTKPLTEDNYAFIEFNTSPVLKLCYGCRDGRMFDIVPLLVDAIDSHLHAA